eukprot:gene23744-9302_t
MAAEVPEDVWYDEEGYVSLVGEKKKTSKVEATAADVPEDVRCAEEGYVALVEEKKAPRARSKVEAMAAEVPEDVRYDEEGNVSLVKEKKASIKSAVISAEHRAAISAAIKKRWEDPEYRARTTEAIRAAISDSIEKEWEDPEYRAPGGKRKPRTISYPKGEGPEEEGRYKSSSGSSSTTEGVRAPRESVDTAAVAAAAAQQKELLEGTKQLVLRVLSTRKLVGKLEHAMASMVQTGAQTILTGAKCMLHDLDSKIPSEAHYDEQGAS